MEIFPNWDTIWKDTIIFHSCRWPHQQWISNTNLWSLLAYTNLLLFQGSFASKCHVLVEIGIQTLSVDNFYMLVWNDQDIEQWSFKNVKHEERGLSLDQARKLYTRSKIIDIMQGMQDLLSVYLRCVQNFYPAGVLIEPAIKVEDV